jgi:hypothetical protein
MAGADAGSSTVHRWFFALIAGSAALLLITIASYALADEPYARLLFWLGLGGEQNIGAWWSGALLVVAAFLVFDGFFDSAKPVAERRGWLALGFALLLLSFDEIASLHEYLSALGFQYLAALGVVGLALASYGMERLYRARVNKRTMFSLVLAFGLLATVPIHEFFQHQLEWNDPLIYGVRAFFEEGTELLAMLIFVSVGRSNAVSLWRSSQDFVAALVRHRQLVSLTALALWPCLVAASFVMPRQGGVDWLAVTLFLACAVLAARGAAVRGELEPRALTLILFYVAASAAANAVSFRWDPVLFGTAVNIRGIVFALLVLNGAMLLKANRRPVSMARAALVAAAIAASAIAWPSSQLLWCALPPAVALLMYGIESKQAARSKTAPLAAAPLQAPASP